MSELIKPYEVSVWDDILVNDTIDGEEISYYKEHKLAVIGSNTMTGYGKIYNVVLHKNKNSEKTLSFCIKNKYYDPTIEQEVTNPFCDFLINERKIKLHYEDKWYDFIIKEVEETDNENEWSYTALDAFVLELSKNGYGVTLDAELNNNQGTAAELAIQTLQDTNWDVVNIDVPPPVVHETLYEAVARTQFIAHKMDDDEEETINNGDRLLVFYSYINNKDGKNVQFIKRTENDEYKIDDNYNIDALNYRLDFDTVIDDNKRIYTTDGTLLIQCGNIFTKYQAYRILYKQLSTYDSVMERNVDQFSAGEITINHYTDNKYTTSTVVTSFVTNGSNFNVYENGALYGWDKYTSKNWPDIELVTQPRVPTKNSGSVLENLSKIKQLEGYLEVKFGGNGSPINNTDYLLYNSGFHDNAAIIGDVAKGDPFLLRMRAGMSDNQMTNDTILQSLTEDSHIEAVVGFYNQNEIEQDKNKEKRYIKQLSNSQILLHFKSNEIEYLNDRITGGELQDGNTQYIIGGVIQEPSTKYIYEYNGQDYVWSNDQSKYILQSSSTKFLNYYILEATATRSITAEDVSKSNIGIFFYTTDSAKWYYLQDVQLTRLFKDKNGNRVLTGNVPEAAVQSLDYYYVAPKANTKKNTVKLYRTLQEIADALSIDVNTIKPIYNKAGVVFNDRDQLTFRVQKLNARELTEQFHVRGYSLEKILSVDASKSNCFNILQSIAETFECWIDLDVVHNEDGSLMLSKYGLPTKQVLLKRYSGKDNFAGFKYGINLGSISRTVDSNELVTKLIVEDTQCDYVDSGVVSISKALSNISKESYIFNFDYLLNKGIIKDREKCEADLLKYYTEIGEKNKVLISKQAEFNRLELALTKTEANRNIYTNLINAAEEKYNEALDDFKEIVGQPYNNFQNEPLPTNLTNIDTVLDKVGQLYSCSAVINNYRGLEQNTQQEYLKLEKQLYGLTEHQVTINFYSDSRFRFANVIHVEVDDYNMSFGCSRSTRSQTYSTSINKKSFDIPVLAASHVQLSLFADNQYNICNTAGQNIDYIDINVDEEIQLRLIPKVTQKGLKQEIDELIEDKKAYIKDFTNKYSRFILEGTWSSNEYISDDLYYLDAMQSSRVSAFPQVTYNINVVDVAGLDEYHGYTFDTGDKTYIEDTEFFGWVYSKVGDSSIRTPAREEVIISETEWHLDDPSENSITVQNYKSNFEDLFQRIQATVQTVQYNENAYPKTSSILSQDGLLNEQLLIQSLIAISGKPYTLTSDGSVVIDGDQILIQNLINTANRVRINSEGIGISNDGGENWSTVINGQGIDIGKVFSTFINTEKIILGNANNPSFRWDSSGIDAYKTLVQTKEDDPRYDLGTYVRFDQYGLYGISDKTDFVPTGTDSIKENADFGLTWGGFFIKSSYTNGYVSISSDNDFQVIQKINGEEHERVKIGAIDFDGGVPSKYGIKITNKDDEDVFVTDSDGNLAITNLVRVGAIDSADQRTHILIDGEKASISTSNYSDGASYGWMINSEGDAVFNNITARGAIKTAVFEYAEIQAVGGVFLFRPSSTIRSARLGDLERGESETDLVLEVEKPQLFIKIEYKPTSDEEVVADKTYYENINGRYMVVDHPTGSPVEQGYYERFQSNLSWCKISNYLDNGEDPDIFADENILANNGLAHVYHVSDVNLGSKEVILDQGINFIQAMTRYVLTSDEEIVEGKTYYKKEGDIYVIVTNPTGIPVDQHYYELAQSQEEILTALEGGSLVDMGTVDGKSYGIGVNSSDNTVDLPKRAISLFNTQIYPNGTELSDKIKVTYDYQAILGTLPELPYEASDNTPAQVNVLYHKYLKDTQGIYTNNMYIGDADQFIAFYTDTDDNNEKKLRIQANEINFLTNGKYQTLSNYLSIDENGVSLSNNGQWKLNLAPEGMHILDATNKRIADYLADGITFANDIPYYIGNDTTYIKFFDSDGDGTPDAIGMTLTDLTIGSGEQSTSITDSVNGSILIDPRDPPYGPKIIIGNKIDQLDKLNLQTTSISFMQDGRPAAAYGNEGAKVKDITTTTIHMVNQSKQGVLFWIMRGNKHLSLKL